MPSGGSRFQLVAGGERRAVELPLYGLYNVENFLAAAACAWSLGLSLEEIADAAATVSSTGGRGAVHHPGQGITVVDDSYNSNPRALRRALESAAALPGQRRWAVLGEMLELGPAATELHRESGSDAVELGFGPVAGVGPLTASLVEEVRATGGEGLWFPDAAAAASWARDELRSGDTVLVKGSRGVGLEMVVRELLSLGGET